VSLYDPGRIENWQAERGGKTYNLMVDLSCGAVIYAEAGEETRPFAPEPTTTKRDIGDSTAASTTAQPKQSVAPTSTAVSSSKTRQPITMSRETKHDGLVLKVFTGYQHQFTGEPFTLTATITNTTGKDITYGVGSGTPNVHLEIPVRIPGFTDFELEGKMWTEDYRFATLRPAKPSQRPSGFRRGALPAGEYEGTAVFTYYIGTGENPGDAKRLEL